MVWRLRRARSHFSPPVRMMEELHCVSRSTTSTRCSPIAAKPCASMVVTVDLPTPPLRLATAKRMPTPNLPYRESHPQRHLRPNTRAINHLSPRMSFGVSLKQALAVNSRIGLRRGKACVAQQFLDHAQIGAAA